MKRKRISTHKCGYGHVHRTKKQAKLCRDHKPFTRRRSRPRVSVSFPREIGIFFAGYLFAKHFDEFMAGGDE